MAVWRAPPAKFTPLSPSRILDTRTGQTTIDGLYNGIGALSLNAQLDLPVAGRGGVPATGAGAVVMNVTVVDPVGGGYITAWPTGNPLPWTSNINFVAHQTIPNLITVKLGTSGKVSLYNASYGTDLLADVAGWFPASSAFVPLVPARLLDTRTGQSTIDGQFNAIGAVGPVQELDLTVAGRGGVPSTGADSVVPNDTVTET